MFRHMASSLSGPDFAKKWHTRVPQARRSAPLSLWSDSRAGTKRLVEIGLEIFHVLEPDRESHAPVEDAELGADLRREALMRRGRRMAGQALGVTEIVADLEYRERIEEAKRVLLVALDLECNHRSAGSHLPLGERSLRMISAAGIEHARDL